MTDNRFLWEYDEALGFDGLCGIDEVGRGPLAGPVCAAAVILPAMPLSTVQTPFPILKTLHCKKIQRVKQWKRLKKLWKNKNTTFRVV